MIWKDLSNSFSSFKKFWSVKPFYFNLSSASCSDPQTSLKLLFSAQSQFESIFLEVWLVRQGRGSLGLIRFCPIEQKSQFPIDLSASMSQHSLPVWPKLQIHVLSDTQGRDVGFFVIVLKEKKKGSCFFQWFNHSPYQRPPDAERGGTGMRRFGFRRWLCRRTVNQTDLRSSPLPAT